jgi:tetratricopeptide (TPR) repeat protein
MPTTPPTAGSAPIPSQLAHFEIIRRLGAGGMAEVFLAKKRGAESTYKVLVVKRILPTHTSSRRFRSMFIEEAQLATRLNHPNVVQVYEFFDSGDEGHILSMEYVEGPDLGMLMSSAKAKGTRIPPWVAAWIIAEAAKGLHYAHEKKDETGTALEIVHRDVSPQNVLLSFEGGVKIADFGIASAKLFVEEAGVIKGKFGYMSPEQARGERIDRRSDLYALGVILWEGLTGRPLHGGLGGEALLDIVRSGTVEPPSTYVRDLPAELESITMKLLSPKREDRFPSGRELASAIARALLQKQELVDAAILEATIAQLVIRENTHPGVSEPPAAGSAALSAPGAEAGAPNVDLRTQAAVPLALSSLDGPGAAANLRPAGVPAFEGDEGGAGVFGPREVRHIALVTLRLHGLAAAAGSAKPALAKALEGLRTMLGEMAYKRGMRWQWKDGASPASSERGPHLSDEARAIAGLSSNPTRAAADAAWLALETHEAIAGIKDDFPVPVGASIGIVRGIASGTRDPEGNLVRYTLHDPASHLAEALLTATPLYRTWVAGGVYRLVRRDFRWGDAPTLEIKPDPKVENLPPTMRIYALERSLSREEKDRAPSATSDLVGRDAEKAELHAAFHEAVNANGGGGNTVSRAVVGELGIGKTALVATFLSELPPNARLVRVECSPVRMEVPFSTVADIVRDAIGTTGEEPFEEVAALIARAGGGAASGDATNPMVARLAELATNRTLGRAHGDDEDASYRRRLIISGVRNLVAAIALSQPVVLVLEGMHWADKQSVEILAELLREPDPMPILVVLVTRPDDRIGALLEGKVRVDLQGLSAEEQVRLVETRLGVREGVRQVCAELLPRVGGNPFFLLEMVDALLERGTLEIKESGETSPGGEPIPVLVRTERGEGGFASLPSTLEQLLANRLQELPAEEHVICDWLAIAGGPLGVADLVKLAEDEDEEAIMRLCARGVVDRKVDAVDFRHPLTRDVAYLALGPGDRVRMHRALGEHLMHTPLARGLSAAIVARHLARGEADAEAGECYLEAAISARNGYQTPLAIRYFNRALAHLPPDDPRRIAAHEALEAIYRVLGRRRDRVRHLDALRKLAKRIASISAPLGPSAAARTGTSEPFGPSAAAVPRTSARAACLALLRTARFDLDEGRLSRGLPVARQAAEVAHAGGFVQFEIEAEGLVSELLRELGDVQGALAACDRALAACDPKVHPNVPPRSRAEVLRSRGVLLRRVGRVREAVDAYVDAIAVFRRVGARRQEARGKNALGYAMFVQGRYEDAIALFLESIQIDLAIGGRFQIARTLCNIGQAYSRVGDIPRAEAYLRRARDAHERYGDQDGRAETLLMSAEVLIEKGELGQADQFIHDAEALNAATNNAYDITHAAIVAALLSRERRDARAAISRAVEARRSAEDHVLVAFHFYAMAVEAASRIDAGEMHAATLLATTALGTVETLQGSEYGLEVRVLCADALKRAGSPQAPHARQVAVDYAVALMNTIRDPRLRRRFAERPIVAGLFDATPVPIEGRYCKVGHDDDDQGGDSYAPPGSDISLPEMPTESQDEIAIAEDSPVVEVIPSIRPDANVPAVTPEGADDS